MNLFLLEFDDHDDIKMQQIFPSKVKSLTMFGVYAIQFLQIKLVPIVSLKAPFPEI